MRIEQTKTKVETVGDIVSVKTDRLIIETPDPVPAPKPVVVNIDVKPVLNVVEHTDAASLRRGWVDGSRPTPSPVQAARTALEGKDPFSNEVHFNATPGESIPLRYAAMQPRRPDREVPLWAFARQFFVEEFTVLDPRRADILADHFMEQYRAKWKDGKGV